MTKLTSINLSSGVTPNDLIHIVNTGDTTQSIDGSSYKATLGQIASIFEFTGGSSNCITDLYVTNVHGCSPITIHDSVQSNGSSSTGLTSFAFGNNVTAIGEYSHAEGYQSVAGWKGFTVDYYSAGTVYITAYGNLTGFFIYSDSFLLDDLNNLTPHSGYSWNPPNFKIYLTDSPATYAASIVADIYDLNATLADRLVGEYSHAEGYKSTAAGNASHAEGGYFGVGSNLTDGGVAIGRGSHAEGGYTTSIGDGSHAEGVLTTSIGYGSHAEGLSTTAIGNGSHAEGGLTNNYYVWPIDGGTAIGGGSHAEGIKTTSIGIGSHAEGGYFDYGTYAYYYGGTAIGNASHAEGIKTTSVGIGSHAEGYRSTAYGDYSHVGGYYNSASSSYTGIFAGSGNTITGNSESSVIAGGIDNTISGHTNAFIGGGQNNLIDFCASAPKGNANESIIGGNFNEIYTAINSSVIGGSGNILNNSKYGGQSSTILGGKGNTMTNGNISTIIGGSGNTLGDTSCALSYSTIIGGYGNNIESVSTGGVNMIANSISSSIVSLYALILNSNTSKILGISYNSSIIGGSGNTINQSNYSGIIGGSGNTVDGVLRSVIVGGSNITAINDDYVYVPSLNIKTLGSSTSVNNLGIDINGNVVTGTTGGGGISITPYNNVGSTTIINWDVSGVSSNYEVTLTGTSTLNINNVRNGEYGTIIVKQDGVGSRTLSFGTINGASGAGKHKVVNGGGGAPTLTSNASATDILSFTYNGTYMFWTVGNDYI